MADADEEVRITLRLPAALRDRIAKEANQSGRSMNGEIVVRLEKTLVDDDKLATVEEDLAELWRRFDDLEAKLREHDQNLFPHRYDWK